MTNSLCLGRFQSGVFGALLVGCLVTACGGNALRDGDQASAGASGAAPGSAGASGATAAGSGGDDDIIGVGGVGGPYPICPQGLPTPAEIAATPRADQNLELLALKLSGSIVADQAIYDRVVRDVGTIRAQAPVVAGIQYWAGDGKSIYVAPDAATYSAMRSGQYQDWDCLNKTYVVSSMQFDDAKPPFSSSLVLTLKGIYDIQAVANQYAALPGVTASPNSGNIGGGPTICVTPESALWHYVFDQAGGDCPAGCTEHTYYHFTTSADGTVKDLGQIPAGEESPYTSNAACR